MIDINDIVRHVAVTGRVIAIEPIYYPEYQMSGLEITLKLDNGDWYFFSIRDQTEEEEEAILAQWDHKFGGPELTEEQMKLIGFYNERMDWEIISKAKPSVHIPIFDDDDDLPF